MMSDNFDLDVTFEPDEVEPDLSGVSKTDLERAIAQLVPSLAGVARGILVEERTMSDVSQALAIRQPELVRRLHRSKILIGEFLGL